ncbi:unnamed protein product [Polarella glacialis]|uniref:Uncharacterized protein n=1 Tax=Polarella glacialis TaxID=89957 RepID=A0A813H476_POLGL|nr:unnamed protein product [Polarella glacialis]
MFAITYCTSVRLLKEKVAFSAAQGKADPGDTCSPKTALGEVARKVFAAQLEQRLEGSRGASLVMQVDFIAKCKSSLDVNPSRSGVDPLRNNIPHPSDSVCGRALSRHALVVQVPAPRDGSLRGAASPKEPFAQLYRSLVRGPGRRSGLSRGITESRSPSSDGIVFAAEFVGNARTPLAGLTEVLPMSVARVEIAARRVESKMLPSISSNCNCQQLGSSDSRADDSPSSRLGGSELGRVRPEDVASRPLPDSTAPLPAGSAIGASPNSAESPRTAPRALRKEKGRFITLAKDSVLPGLHGAQTNGITPFKSGRKFAVVIVSSCVAWKGRFLEIVLEGVPAEAAIEAFLIDPVFYLVNGCYSEDVTEQPRLRPGSPKARELLVVPMTLPLWKHIADDHVLPVEPVESEPLESCRCRPLHVTEPGMFRGGFLSTSRGKPFFWSSFPCKRHGCRPQQLQPQLQHWQLSRPVCAALGGWSGLQLPKAQKHEGFYPCPSALLLPRSSGVRAEVPNADSRRADRSKANIGTRNVNCGASSNLRIDGNSCPLSGAKRPVPSATTTGSPPQKRRRSLCTSFVS